MDNRYRILSIDDNDVNQKLIERILSPDYTLKTAHSGAGGLQCLGEFNPDLILLDVEMPHIDGLSVCRMIRALPQLSTIPIVFVSCRRSDQDELQCFQAGGDDYLAKPIDVQALLDKISSNLKRAHRRKQLEEIAPNRKANLSQSVERLHLFLVKLISLQTFEELGNATLKTLDKLGLKGALAWHFNGDCFSSIGPLTDLEQSLIQQARKPAEPDISGRLLWGSPHIGCLLQNMLSPRDKQFGALNRVVNTLLNAVHCKCEIFLQESQQHPSDKKLYSQRDRSLSVYSYKLECAIEELEKVCNLNLEDISNELRGLARNTAKQEFERQKLIILSQRCKGVNTAIHEQCAQIQTQYLQLMSDVHQDETAS